ncbi:MAG: DNA-3-methyladenine glycosylase I [Methylococcales bacterium]
MKETKRCDWPGSDPLYIAYHDLEWGVPEFDDRALFAKLILDGAQAGLSWITILRKREAYYQAFDHFDAEKIARYDERDMIALMQNPGIVRNELKIRSVVKNARGFLKIIEESGSFSDFLWQFVDAKPIVNHWHRQSDIPALSEQSKAMSKTLKRYGFSFVGPTILYAFMQAVGMVNDHVVDCFRHEECRILMQGAE